MENKYKPILFSTEMVQAILAVRKTQTRRTQGLSSLNKNPDLYGLGNVQINGVFNFYLKENEKGIWIEPKYQPGDILWVRETFIDVGDQAEFFEGIRFHYKADNSFVGCWPWKPSIHMPKEAARIFLEVTNVRCERLQDISEEDAIAEGVESSYTVCRNPGYAYKNYEKYYDFISPISSFASLWRVINGADSWKANPWVWVYQYKKIEKPEVWPQ
ncbi:hypothetical protein ACFO4P_16930 [Epilithonimonas pallida]|uniref:Uncharacterized protein n=1 Tax=Epilithonimonas pallida TaxID=373671 RepID=A0ABY1R3W2_9FLAO|nr:hypothetical protein [Epilithonimonas pallida]SMP94668.1 hypothetical protein SAMN05421679_10671 [Epilithonimonas pallida]